MIHAGIWPAAAATTLALGLILAGCSGSVPGDEETNAVTESEAQAGDSATEDFAVVVVANVDQLTAEGALEQLADAGFDGFQIEGSAEDGYDVFKAGYSQAEAQQVADEVAAQTGYQPMPWQGDNLP